MILPPGRAFLKCTKLCVERRTNNFEVNIVNNDGIVYSADLGNSSNYSNKNFFTFLKSHPYGFFFKKVFDALKTVVEKVFLRVALMQDLVDPKNYLGKPNLIH